MPQTLEGLKNSELIELFKFGEQVMSEMRSAILQLWNERNFQTELKSDDSPVTIVDRKAEELARDRISARYPDHGIIGEEYGNENSNSDYQWTIDPIDGTANLADGIPTFGSLLGLRFRNRAVVGFIDHPALGISVAGCLGNGVCANGVSAKLPLRLERPLRREIINLSTMEMFARTGRGEVMHHILRHHGNVRTYYDCFAHTLAVRGNIGGSVEFNNKIWDLTPTEILITEAGGKYVYLEGSSSENRSSFISAAFGKAPVVDYLVKLIAECGAA